jgi:hypothetical protein
MNPLLQPLEANLPAAAEADPAGIEVLPGEALAPVGVRRAWPIRLLKALASGAGWLFGLAALVLALAVAVSIPIVQFLSLGYLLEASARIARSGRFATGLVGIRQAARAGSIVLGAWLWLWPVRFCSSMATSAHLIQPGSRSDRLWTIGLWTLTVLVVLHIVGACWRGGKLRHFLWPAPLRVARLAFRRGSYAEVRDAVCDFVFGMRLPYFFWLGLRGFVGGVLWLVVPISIMALTQRQPIWAFVGGLLMTVVLLYLPFVLVRFAAENRFRALFEISAIRQWFRRGPWAFWGALFVALALALPLYPFKIELIPRDAIWLPSILFVLFALPSHLLTGWACGWASHRPRPRHWISCWLARFAMLPVAGAYVIVTFFSLYVAWDGFKSLYAQHAFLLPTPFLGN